MYSERKVPKRSRLKEALRKGALLKNLPAASPEVLGNLLGGIFLRFKFQFVMLPKKGAV